ncbi:MAG: NRDE family protein, partial [Deltaproteobacteria bacterium]|nr:NRDE family protein [Deltaproteobacteria bacterium]
SILTDQSIPDDSLLPDTGVELEWEKILSPLFIRSDTYGTRSSTVMLMDKDGHIEITERTYDLKNNLKYSDRQFSIPS